MARKRVVEAPSLHSWEDVNDALRQIAEAQIALGEIQSDMQKQILGAPQAAVYGLCVADPFAWMSADAVLCIPLIKNIMRENYDYLYGSGQKLIER